MYTSMCVFVMKRKSSSSTRFSAAGSRPPSSRQVHYIYIYYVYILCIYIMYIYTYIHICIYISRALQGHDPRQRPQGAN